MLITSYIQSQREFPLVKEEAFDTYKSIIDMYISFMCNDGNSIENCSCAQLALTTALATHNECLLEGNFEAIAFIRVMPGLKAFLEEILLLHEMGKEEDKLS